MRAQATTDPPGPLLRRARGAITWALLAAALAVSADVDLPTKFTNIGGIINTRHNLSMTPIGAGSQNMNPYRNDYGQVCVYCHTPHGANQTLDAPLWNRTMPTTPYQTYAAQASATISQPISDPGINSLTCLSCHDGTLAVDSVINMPNRNAAGVASTNYNSASNRDTVQNTAFLNGWTNASGADATAHMRMNTAGCLVCHNGISGESVEIGAGATDFRVFAIGTDLRDDHPVGVLYPAAGPGVDFKEPDAISATLRFFDGDSDGRAGTDEVRLYDSGDGFEVECASCHDPHGVPSGGPGTSTTHIPSFLRVDNRDGSALCMTCHTK